MLSRARPLRKNETISVVTDLSYKPQKFNTTYQRASTPDHTFYGCLFQPEFQPQGYRAMARATGLMESMPLMRNKTSKGIWKIAFGKWEIMYDIYLASIYYHKEFATKIRKQLGCMTRFNGNWQMRLISRSRR